MELKIEYMSTADLKPYENNAKIHTAEQIEQIKESIKEFSMNDPIGIWHDQIVEGHGRWIACKELGIDKVPVIRLDDLTDEQRKAYMLVHNKLTMNTDFDIDILNMELEDISFDMGEFGFSEVEEIIEENEIDDEVEKYEKGDVPFSEYLNEVSQYVVLKFNTEADWNYISNVLGLTKVKMYSTRKDGEENGMMQVGLGRVVDGMDAVKKIENNYKALYGENVGDKND